MADHMTAEQLRAEIRNVALYARQKCADAVDIDALHFALIAIENSLDQLAARLSGMAAGWQPIETAPMDGTIVWAFNGEQGRMKWVSGSNYALWIWDECTLSDIDPSPEQPSHWMPLPAAPEPPHV